MKNESKRGRGRPRKSGESSAPAPVQTLDRALLLLRTIADQDAIGLSALAEQLSIPAPTAYRLLTTLQQHGVTEFNEHTQQWRVGVETFRMGSAFLRGVSLADRGRPLMHNLLKATGETVNLAKEEDGDVVFISQVESSEPIRAFFRPGTRGEIHTSGIGKALLAELPRHRVKALLAEKPLQAFTDKTLTSSEALYIELDTIKARGWSVDDEERHLGMRCIAAAIYNEFGEAVAGISVSGPTVRITDEKVTQFGPWVKECADEITNSIGGLKPQDSRIKDNPLLGW